ncbi:MAG: hypothetical protein RL557_226 [archaeon]|jgi:hypothetical protein
MVEHSLATLLSNLFHLKGKEMYEKAKQILEGKGYVINEISPGKTYFRDLK